MFLDILRNQSENATAKFIWLGADGREEEILTGVEIYRRAGVVAHMLIDAGLKRGDRVMIAYPFGLDFLAAFIGCARAGVICCSVYPPDPTRLRKSLSIFRNFAKDADTDFVLTTTNMKHVIESVEATTFKYIITDLVSEGDKPFVDVQVSHQDIMFIQYSSGSTGIPKGVMISHGSLYRNMNFNASIRPVHKRMACWLPQYHDYGLVDNYLQALFQSATLVSMSPHTFIRNPLVWAHAISKYNCGYTGGPNFAFAHLHRKWSESGKPTLGLSDLVQVTIAAEPVHKETIEKMIEMGIRPGSIAPSYGMAENVVSSTKYYGEYPTIHNERVACGRVNFDRKRIHVDSEGEIYIQGDDLASGYWNRPELTQETFHYKLPRLEGEWLRTGDLGFIHDNLLYVTGRKKELIKVRGKNYFPTDIEADVEKVFSTWLRPGCSAAFQFSEESIGYVAEVRDEKSIPDTEKISQHILAEHGIQCTYIKLSPKGSLPKTTSGKIKRVQVQSDARSDTVAKKKNIHQCPDATSFIKAISGGESSLDLDNSLAENGADSMTQVQIENMLAASRVLTERQKNMLRSGSSLRQIADELQDSPERPRNIDTVQVSIQKGKTFQISVVARGIGMCLINLINIAIPLSIAGAVYELSVSWSGILVWAALYSACVCICLRIFTFGGTDHLDVGSNTTAYLRWYFCRNMLTIWNVFIGTWIAGTIPYVLFLRLIGARIHPSAIVDHLFEYVDARLAVGSNARVAGICDTAAHLNVYTLRLGPVVICANANVRGSSRMWPGSRLGKNSSIDHWCRLYFNEQVAKDNMAVTGAPSVANPNVYTKGGSADVLWINVSRLLVVPAFTIASFYVASYVSVSDPFFQYVTTFILGLLIIVFLAPVLKRVTIDLLHGGVNVAETVDNVGGIAFNAVWCWICPNSMFFWNLYMRTFGANIELDTASTITLAGSVSEASRLTVRNGSFISVGVRLSGVGPVIIDNSECAIGAVVPEGGLVNKQLLRHGHTRPRSSDESSNKPNLIRRAILSLCISWLVSATLIMSIYPLYLAGAAVRPLIENKTLFVISVFVPGVFIQTAIIFPILIRIFQLMLNRVPHEMWFTVYYFARIWGSFAFFAGSPIYNIALNICGAKVALDARVFKYCDDEGRISIQNGVVSDSYTLNLAHLYSQRTFHIYETRLMRDTLYEGPGNYVGDPAKLH